MIQKNTYQRVIRTVLNYFFEFPKLDISKLNFKETAPSETKKHLERLVNILNQSTNEDWKLEFIKDEIMEYADTLTKRGEALHPLRYCLSGAEHSPDPFTIAEIIGKPETLSRINYAISLID